MHLELSVHPWSQCHNSSWAHPLLPEVSLLFLCFPFLTLVVVVADMRGNFKSTALCYYLLLDWNLVVLVHKFHGGKKKVLTLEASPVRTSILAVAADGLHLGITDLCLWPRKNEWSTLALGPTARWASYRQLVDWLHKGTLLSPGSLRVTVCFSSYVFLQRDAKLWPWLQNFQTSVCFLKAQVLQLLITPRLTDIPGFSCYQPNSLEDDKNENQCQLQPFFTSYEGEPRTLVANQASTLLIQNFSCKGASILHLRST